MRQRILVAIAVVGVTVCTFAVPAAAHVTIDPSSAPKGSTGTLSFLAPNEDPTAKMTELQVAFPTPPQTPIATVTVEAKPGWTVQVTTTKLTTPIVTDDGTINDIVSIVDWKAKTVADGVAAQQFGEFTVDADGLPKNENEVVFKAIQIYSDGKKVRWIDPVTSNGPNPTPILQLTNPDGSATPTTTASAPNPTVAVASTKDNSARALSIIAAALGAVALVFATGALMRKRRA
ncbi:MAG TPA: YcnI family protein [Acidimicrobiia bacterium]|nr:YcnI family protein [Acidimicrobiia bacterium]